MSTYNDFDYLRLVPSNIRTSIHTCNRYRKFIYPYRKVSVKPLNSMYTIQASVYTLDTLEEIYKDTKLKTAHIAICYLKGLDIPTLKRVHSKNSQRFSIYTKATNYTKFRYMNFIGKGDLNKAKLLMTESIKMYINYIWKIELNYITRSEYVRYLEQLMPLKNGKCIRQYLERLDIVEMSNTHNWKTFTTLRSWYKLLIKDNKDG